MDTKNNQKENAFTTIINVSKDLMALLRDFFIYYNTFINSVSNQVK